MAGPLKGVRVLDLTRVLAGPSCTQSLADLGAEIIKIERPKIGDDCRAWGPPFMKDDDGNQTTESAYFMSTNRGKLSVALDISTAEGQKILKELVKDADVFIENYKVGGLKKYGLDYEALSQINPRLIYCSITGYGQNGPRANEPGYDYVVQGLTGLMSITGERDDLPGGGPQRTAVGISDLMAGANASICICSALYFRQQTGEGQYIDIALMDTLLQMLGNQALNYLTSSNIPKRCGNAHTTVVPYSVFKGSDREFIIACGNDSQFASLAKAIGMPELSEDPRFIANRARSENIDALNEILDKRFADKTANEWVELISAVNVPVGPINNLKEALEEPQVAAREMLIEMEHPLKKHNYKIIGSPFKMSKTPVAYEHAPPLLGQHTKEILSQYLNLEEQDLENLSDKGIISML